MTQTLFFFRGAGASIVRRGFLPLVCAWLLPLMVTAAQPDYTNAIWRAAYPGHWYTTGNAHAFVVEHDMEGYYWSTISYFQQSGTQASIHYCVNGLQNGSDSQGHSENNPGDPPAGEITQMVEDQYWAWHVRCWNRYMFGTEHEGFVTSPVWYSDAMYQASGRLTRFLCDTYNIPKDRNHVIGHNEWQNAGWLVWMTNNWPQIDPTCNNHTDPGQYWDWNKFMSIVSGAPGFGLQPWSRLVEPGSNVTFTVSATGASPLSLQWRKNGTNIAGATSTNYSIASVQPGDAGGFSIVASNAYGSITSRVATLTVSPAWVTAFGDNLDSDTSTNWGLFWGAGNAIADYSTNWAFDYGAQTYVANGVTNFIPSAPNSAGTKRGLKLSVNKNDAVAATAGVSLYLKNLLFSNDYSLRFDLWMNYNGPSGGGSGSTEYATFGLNHTGNEVNWTTAASTSDGLWFAVDGEGGSSGGDYRAYAGNGAAAPTQLSFGASGMAASGATSDDNGDAFFHGLFPSPQYETAGVPGKHWVQVELTQIGNVVTWQLNGVVVAQRTNASPYAQGTVMLGYMDPYSSIANPAADNYALFDNVRVLVAAGSSMVKGLTVTARPNSAIINWTSFPATTCQIEYGVAPSFQEFSPLESSPRGTHSVLLNGLVRNTNYVFRIHSDTGAQSFVSDQYQFSTDISLILDNPQAVYSGDWVLGTSSPDQYGGYFQYTPATTDPTPSAQATYTPNIPVSGKYDVFIWYPQGSNRSTNALVSVFYNGGYLVQGIDQTSNGGQWNLLAANVPFNSGTEGFVSIGNNGADSSSVVVADAVRFAYAPSQDIPIDGSVPVWWSSYFFGSNVDGSIDHDGDGYSAVMEYVMGTDPLDGTSHFNLSMRRVISGLELTFTPWLNGRSYTLQRTTNLVGNAWTTLPDVPQVAAGRGYFFVTNNFSPGFYRVATRLTP